MLVMNMSHPERTKVEIISVNFKTGEVTFKWLDGNPYNGECSVQAKFNGFYDCERPICEAIDAISFGVESP